MIFPLCKSLIIYTFLRTLDYLFTSDFGGWWAGDMILLSHFLITLIIVYTLYYIAFALALPLLLSITTFLPLLPSCGHYILFYFFESQKFILLPLKSFCFSFLG